MKIVKNISKIILMLLAMVSFSQCSTAKKLEKSIPFEIGEAYYQQWVSGAKGAGSGINLFIPITSNPNNIILDSVYFKGKQSKLVTYNKTVFVGRFQTAVNQQKDIIMSNEPYTEYGNKVPELPEKSPFKLNNNECVISYKQGNTVKYYKISNILIIKPKHYPSSKPY